MIGTIVKPWSAQMFSLANQFACVSRCLPQQVSSLRLGSSPDQGECFPPVGVSTGIRAARARSQVYLPNVICQEPQVAVLDFEFPFLGGFGARVFVALALAVILRYLLCSRIEPVALRVRRVRLNCSEDVRTDESKVAQSRISDRRVVSWCAGSFLRDCWVGPSVMERVG